MPADDLTAVVAREIRAQWGALAGSGRDVARIELGSEEYQALLCHSGTLTYGTLTMWGSAQVKQAAKGIRVIPEDWQGYGQGATRGAR